MRRVGARTDDTWRSSRDGPEGKARGTQIWLLDRSGRRGAAAHGREGPALVDYDGRRIQQILLTLADRDPGEPDEPAPEVAADEAAPTPRSQADRDRPVPLQAGTVGYLTPEDRPFPLYDVATKKVPSL